jgi:hypothetical protein
MLEQEHRSGCKLTWAIFGGAVRTGFATRVFNLKPLKPFCEQLICQPIFFFNTVNNTKVTKPAYFRHQLI